MSKPIRFRRKIFINKGQRKLGKHEQKIGDVIFTILHFREMHRAMIDIQIEGFLAIADLMHVNDATAQLLEAAIRRKRLGSAKPSDHEIYLAEFMAFTHIYLFWNPVISQLLFAWYDQHKDSIKTQRPNFKYAVSRDFAVTRLAEYDKWVVETRYRNLHSVVLENEIKRPFLKI